MKSYAHDAENVRLTLAGRPYTFTAKRHTFTYTRMRMELGHGELDVCRAALDFAAWAHTVCRTLIERGSQVREDDSVYGYVNGNGNEGLSGQQRGGQGEFNGLAHF